jgi:methionine biosynthesis protein MetW
LTAGQLNAGVDWHLTSSRDRAFDDTIAAIVGRGARVLDLGSGGGELLSRLRTEKGIREQGLETDGEAVAQCISRGLTVAQGDIEEDLPSFRDASFDLAIADQVLPLVRNPVKVIEESLRVARQIVVTFPNFSSWAVRFQVFFRGTLPMTPSLPYQWHETPHIRYFTVADFRSTCRERGWRVLSEFHLASRGEAGYREVRFLRNLRASLSLFHLGTQGKQEENALDFR